MFGFLKKKIGDSVKKLSKKVEEKPVELEEKIEKKKEKIAAPKKEISKKEIKKEVKKEKPEVEEKPIEQKKKSFKERFIKTGFKEKLVKKITKKTLSEKDIDDFFSETEVDFLQANVAVEVVEALKNGLKEKLADKDIKRGKTEETIKEAFEESILDILKQEPLDLEKVIKETKKQGRPALFVFLGFNGTGKTTTIAKIGHLLKKKGYSFVLAAGDSYRAASLEQIEEHAKKLGKIKVIKHDYGADPAAVIFDAVEHAKAKGFDCILADSAGRSHADTGLMDELKKICRVNKPDLNILVLDSLAGNDILNQCEKFDKAVGVHGMILTKLDVNEKGGAVLSAAYVTKKPILYIGVGQKYEDIKKYNYKEFAKQLLS